MELPKLTYEEYKELGGEYEEEDFKLSLLNAEAFVRNLIGFNVPVNEIQTEAYKRAVAAAVDVDVVYGHSGGAGEGLGSVQIGSYSETTWKDTSSASTTAYDTDMERAVRYQLVRTGLLCQVV